jgi:hypothetical protein
LNGFSTLRRKQKYIPYGAVLALVLVLSAWLALSLPSPHAYVTSGLVESQEPGIYLPDVYFMLNYTGPGYGNFSYIVTYNSTDGSVRSQSSPVLLAQGYAFKFTLFESWPRKGTLMTRIQVYMNTPPSGHRLVYDRTIYLTESGGKYGPATTGV